MEDKLCAKVNDERNADHYHPEVDHKCFKPECTTQKWKLVFLELLFNSDDRDTSEDAYKQKHKHRYRIVDWSDILELVGLHEKHRKQQIQGTQKQDDQSVYLQWTQMVEDKGALFDRIFGNLFFLILVKFGIMLNLFFWHRYLFSFTRSVSQWCLLRRFTIARHFWFFTNIQIVELFMILSIFVRIRCLWWLGHSWCTCLIPTCCLNLEWLWFAAISLPLGVNRAILFLQLFLMLFYLLLSKSKQLSLRFLNSKIRLLVSWWFQWSVLPIWCCIRIPSLWVIIVWQDAWLILVFMSGSSLVIVGQIIIWFPWN